MSDCKYCGEEIKRDSTAYDMREFCSTDCDMKNEQKKRGCWTPDRGDKCDCPACGGFND